MEPAHASARQSPLADVAPGDGNAPSNSLLESAPQSPQLTDALRIQVAAVAAQQAALIEEEGRLHQQETTLTQQQEQLAAHLEEKRQRVLQMAEQVQTAKAAWQHERQEHAAAAAAKSEELARRQKTLEEGEKNLDTERQRMSLLRRRLKKHFHRRFAAERLQLRKRDIALIAQHRRIEREAEKLQAERDHLIRDRLSFNGDMELGKRQLQAGRQDLKREQQQWQEERARKDADFLSRSATLRQREEAVANAENDLAAAQSDLELKRKIAEQEAQGLENRIQNLRRKVHPLQLKAMENKGNRHSGPSPSESKSPEPPTPSTVTTSPCVDPMAAELDRFASDLADQRLELVEHWQRLALNQEQWEKELVAAADQLAELAGGLPEKEEALLARQESLEAAESALVQKQEELARIRQHLEVWVTRVRLRETTWESERDHLLAELGRREESAENQIKAVVELRRNWLQRRRQELEALRQERAACAALREESAALRQECWKRSLSLDQEQRELSEKTLALEEYRERLLMRSPDVVAAESRLERFRKRYAQQDAAALRSFSQQFDRLQSEAQGLQQRGRDLLRVAEELTIREAALGQRQSAWEESLTVAEAEQNRLRKQLQSSQAQRERSQRQIADLQAEIERLARVLLDEVVEPALPVARAA